MKVVHGWAAEKKTISCGLAKRGGHGGMNRLRVFQILIVNGESIVVVQIVRPPPEPPPRVDLWRRQGCYLVCFVYFCNNCYFCFGVCFFVFVSVCKTLMLDVGDERNLVTVLGFLFPGYGSANYIATAINSESGSRDSGYQFSFCQLTHTLNFYWLFI
ncbi:unnamed protein product [Cuscuta epithymum]|uniref:Transmembrane protein n=1 Tax=Cuscuta epithymum TaxID=186058 RepID=A0AAV0BZB3_9ASTE|nr:unnamed protein product [Cuscuta epithymum]